MGMPDHFVLDVERNVVRETDMARFTEWFAEPSNRVVGYEEIGEAGVSTVFLGLDQNHTGRGAPLYFETRVFGGALDGETRRYTTWPEAEAGHQVVSARVREAEAAD